MMYLKNIYMVGAVGSNCRFVCIIRTKANETIAYSRIKTQICESIQGK
jgi:hypothetical protein